MLKKTKNITIRINFLSAKEDLEYHKRIILKKKSKLVLPE